MVLPGTKLANSVLESTGLRSKLYRHYTQVRAKDRSYKMWGHFTEADATKLIGALALQGASNPRVVYTTYLGRQYVRGVRFELPKEA